VSHGTYSYMYTNAVANYGILRLHLWHDFRNKVFEVNRKLYTPDAEKPQAQTLWGDGGTKTKIYCQGTACQRCVLAALWTVSLGLTKGGNQAKTTEVFLGGGSCISYQFREDVRTYGHQPRYTTDNDAVKTDVCAVRMPTLSHTSCGMLRK